MKTTKSSKGTYSNVKKNKTKSSKRYAILRDGAVFYLSDKNSKYTILKADSYNSKYLGKSMIRNSTRPQRFRKTNWRCNYLYHYFYDVLKDYDVDVDKCVIVEGCYNTNLHTLQRTMTPEIEGTFSKHPNFNNIKIFNNIIKDMFRKMKMYSQLDTPEFEDVYHTNISKNKKPGLRYEECFRMDTKAKALATALEVAERRWDYLSKTDFDNLKHSEMFRGVYTIGARNKRDHTYENDEIAVSRAVHMPELHVELTSAPWFDNFTNKIKEVQRGPIYIGNSILQSERLQKDIEDSSFVLEGDFKRFDSTLYIIAITCGLSFVRCFFNLNSKYVDSHFAGIYDSIAIKDYYTVGGNVFRMFHGLPSGVKSTSLLGSIINLLTLLFCVKDNLRAFNFIVGGDDFLIVCKGSINDKEKFLSRVKERVKLLGMTFKFLDLKYFLSSKIEDCPTFYKYCIYKGKAITPTQSVLERVLMPWNRRYNTDRELFYFLKAVMPSLGEPMSHLYIYYRFYQIMYEAITKRKIRIVDVYQKHLKLHNKMTLNKDRSLLYDYKNPHGNDAVSIVSFVQIMNKKAKQEIEPEIKIF